MPLLNYKFYDTKSVRASCFSYKFMRRGPAHKLPMPEMPPQMPDASSGDSAHASLRERTLRSGQVGPITCHFA